jgi:hypothetical protein
MRGLRASCSVRAERAPFHGVADGEGGGVDALERLIRQLVVQVIEQPTRRQHLQELHLPHLRRGRRIPCCPLRAFHPVRYRRQSDERHDGDDAIPVRWVSTTAKQTRSWRFGTNAAEVVLKSLWAKDKDRGRKASERVAAKSPAATRSSRRRSRSWKPRSRQAVRRNLDDRVETAVVVETYRTSRIRDVRYVFTTAATWVAGVRLVALRTRRAMRFCAQRRSSTLVPV